MRGGKVLFNLEKTIMSVLHKELEYKVDKLIIDKFKRVRGHAAEDLNLQLVNKPSRMGILKPRVGHRVRVRVRVRLRVGLRVGIFSIFGFRLFYYVLLQKKKNFCGLRKTVKEWFISVRYISESYLDELCCEI